MKLRYLLLSLIPVSAFADDLEVTTSGFCNWMGERMACSEVWARFVASPLFIPIILFYVALLVLGIVCWWRIFVKAGQPGWAILVPIYNVVVQFRVGQMSPLWILSIIFPPVFIVAAIIMTHRISRAFGHGVGFTLGLLFLGIIFIPILAFNGDTYRKLEN